MHRSRIEAPSENTAALWRFSLGGSYFPSIRALNYSGATQTSWHQASSQPLTLISSKLLWVSSRSESMALILVSLLSMPMKIWANLILSFWEPDFQRKAQAGIDANITSAISLVLKSMVLSNLVLYSFFRLMKGYYKTMVHLLIFWNIPSTLFPYTYIYIDIFLQSSAAAPANSGSPFYSSVVERSPGRLRWTYTRFPSSEIGCWFTFLRLLSTCP